MRNHTIAVLGSHSALDVCRGAKDLGFKTLVVVQKGRDKTYTKYYKSNSGLGCVLARNQREFECRWSSLGPRRNSRVRRIDTSGSALGQEGEKGDSCPQQSRRCAGGDGLRVHNEFALPVNQCDSLQHRRGRNSRDMERHNRGPDDSSKQGRCLLAFIHRHHGRCRGWFTPPIFLPPDPEPDRSWVHHCAQRLYDYCGHPCSGDPCMARISLAGLCRNSD